MNNEVSIRLAKLNEAKVIHEVLFAAFEEFRDFYSPEGFSDTVLSEEAATARIQEMPVYVAVNRENKVIGTIGWQKVNEREGHIRGMGVLPEWQGLDSPAGSLLQQAEKDALAKGCSILSLDTTEILQRAQNFYKKYGFKKTGKTGNFFGSTIYEFVKTIS